MIVHACILLTHPILMLSPRPGLLRHAGCILDLINTVKGRVPIIGICLEHQAIVEAYGGRIEYSGEIFHGQLSFINHDGLEMFQNGP